MNQIRIKRVYEKTEPTDGYRVLVDRLWPRGLSKENAHIAAWKREVAPSDQVRKAFGHAEENFDRFRSDYLNELSANPQVQAFALLCMEKLASENVTLLYSTKREDENNAAVLREWLYQNLEPVREEHTMKQLLCCRCEQTSGCTDKGDACGKSQTSPICSTN